MIKKGRTLIFENPPKIVGYASAVGKKESKGPLKEFFDIIFMDTTLKQKSFEKAEASLQTAAVNRALKKAELLPSDIDYILGGDLLNQLISSSYGLKSFNIPFLGLYGACSTMAESLGLAALLCESGAAKSAVAVSSSHFCSAERQFRFPLNYGGVRTPTAQWTVTGAGSVVVSQKGEKNLPQIKGVTFGKIEDLGITDINNMGAAMAPAAASTIESFLMDSGTKPSDYDLILTGDLGSLGSSLLVKLLFDNGIDISKQHNDCGLMIYKVKEQDTHCGGSGCGCSASVLCSKILRDLKNKKLNNILFIATGALMSTVSVQQGETIPSIAHLIHITSGEV